MLDYSAQNKKAWEYNAYEFWLRQSGTPSQRAKRDIENPVGMLRRYSGYFDAYEGVKVANICGSCGKKAIPLAILGAEVTVFDISEENKKYALEVAECAGVSVNFEVCDILEFDASKVFGINASACILLIQLSDRPVSSDVCNVYDFEAPVTAKSQFGYLNGQFYSKFDSSTEYFDGRCCFEWRQGVKHDCSKVMELSLRDERLENGKKESVEIEADYIFPLMKSSMFKAPVIHNFSKCVIVTQRKAREETEHLEHEVPKTWRYLNENIELFENRKSSIYRGAPPFSMFGVGEYSYSQYKVGVSGFYKQPMFSVLYSEDKKPVMTDDTSYFICFNSYDMAYVAMLLLNSAKVQMFLKSIAFLDAKRPYTKKVLERIDFEKIVKRLSLDELSQTEQELQLNPYVTDGMYCDFKAMVGTGQLSFA